MLTDFFIGTPALVQEMDISQTPASRLRCLRGRRTDPIKLVQLHCSISGMAFAEASTLLDSMLIREASKNGPWIFLLPGMVEGWLMSASPEDIDRIGVKWAATEEWILDRGTPQTIIPYLAAIAELAREARTQGQGLYVWMSL
jgi:hypothetical protein